MQDSTHGNIIAIICHIIKLFIAGQPASSPSGSASGVDGGNDDHRRKRLYTHSTRSTTIII